MKIKPIAIIALALSTSVFADDLGKLIFSDDFERNESQETTDDPGNGWTTNSKSRAKGNKQVDLKDGAMHIYIHEAADHAVSVVHQAEFTDGAVELRFMLEDEKDVFGVDFADLQYKEVHAGHLFKVTVDPKKLSIDDSKTGGMNMKFYDAKKAKTLTKEQTKLIASYKKTFPVKLETGKWYTMLMKVSGDTLSVAIDGKEFGSSTSEGFGHPTKKLIRLSVPRQSVVDDVKVYSKE